MTDNGSDEFPRKLCVIAHNVPGLGGTVRPWQSAAT